MDREEFIEKNGYPETDKTGYASMMLERQKHKDDLIKRLRSFHMTDEEIQRVFVIIEKAEAEIEKAKMSLDYNTCTQKDMEKVRNKIFKIQNKMKLDCDIKIKAIMKAKFAKVKAVMREKKMR